MQLRAHGGGCCGIYHISGFDNDPATRWPASTITNPLMVGSNDPRRIIELREGTYREVLNILCTCWDQNPRYPGEGGRRILEAHLVDAQIRLWHPVLLANGFKKVVRYYNRNSGNHVNMYLRHTDGFEIFNVSDQIPEQVVPPYVQPAPVAVPAPAPEVDLARNLRVWPRYTDNSVVPVGIEVELIDTQGMRQPVQSNFARVTRFDGRTHGDPNQIFVRFSGEDRDRGLYARRFRAVERLVPPAVEPVAQPQTTVFTQFFANLRDGGLRGPYMTAAQALEAYPRCRNFKRYEVESNGDLAIVDLVREDLAA